MADEANRAKDILAAFAGREGGGTPDVRAGGVVEAVFDSADRVDGSRPRRVRGLWLRGPDRGGGGVPGGRGFEERNEGLLSDGG